MPASIRSFLALPPWMAFMYRAWPSTKGIVLVLAQIGEPVPGEHALDADDQAVAEGRDGVRGRRRAGGEVLVEDDVAVVVEDADVHGSGVQIDAAVESVLLVVEAHGATPEVWVGA